MVEYVKNRYGTAPITVFYDPSGRFFDAIKRRSYYPAHAFWNKNGRRIYSLPAYPFPATPRT